MASFAADIQGGPLSGDGSRVVMGSDTGIGPSPEGLFDVDTGAHTVIPRPDVLPPTDEYGYSRVTTITDLSADGSAALGYADGEKLYWNESEGTRLLSGPGAPLAYGSGGMAITGTGERVALTGRGRWKIGRAHV